MRMKPLLAIAALAVSLAGCTPPPASTSAPQSAQSTVPPRVQLDLQGLGKGSISTSRFIPQAGQLFSLDPGYLYQRLAFIVPKDSASPSGARIAYYLDDANRDGLYPAEEVHQEEPEVYTHLVYRFERPHPEHAAWLQASFEGTEYTADGDLAMFQGGELLIAAHRFGAEANREVTPVLRLAPDAPATLRLAWKNAESGAFETHEALSFQPGTYESGDSDRLELDLRLTTGDDKPLLGLTKAYIDLLRFEVSPPFYGAPIRFLALTPHDDGNYTLGIDILHRESVAGIDVSLSLKTPPVIRDVEY